MINNDQLWLITPECYILMISDGEWGLLVVNNGSFNGILGRSSHKETLEKQLDWDEIIKQSSSVDINCTLGIINWLQTTCIYIYITILNYQRIQVYSALEAFLDSRSVPDQLCPGAISCRNNWCLSACAINVRDNQGGWAMRRPARRNMDWTTVGWSVTL